MDMGIRPQLVAESELYLKSKSMYANEILRALRREVT